MKHVVANIILQQLGGNRFLVMTGAKNLVAGSNTLQFDLPKTKNRANKVRITLEPSDTYKVEYLRFSRKTLDLTNISSFSDIYAENLRQNFESETGLYCTL